jgi:hypothetical protein
VVLSLTSPLPLLYGTTLKKITIHLTSDIINPRLLRIYSVPKPALGEEKSYHPSLSAIPEQTQHLTDPPPTPVTDTTWASNGLSSQKKTRPTRHNHIVDRHKISFASVTLHAHGSSLLGGSAKLFTHIDRSSYLARALDMLLRLRSATHPDPETDPTVNSTQPHDPDRAGDTTNHPDAYRAANSKPLNQPTTREEDHPHEATTKPQLKPRGILYNLLNAAPKNPKPSHLKRKTTSNAWSPFGFSSAQPPPPHANDLHKNTPPYWLKTPSYFSSPVIKCNAPTLTPNPPFPHVRQHPRHNAPVALPLNLPRQIFLRTTFRAVPVSTSIPLHSTYVQGSYLSS